MSAKNSFRKFRRRRTIFSGFLAIFLAGFFIFQANNFPEEANFSGQNFAKNSAENASNSTENSAKTKTSEPELAREVLEKLPKKGRAPKTNYSREQFGNGWSDWGECNTRQKILARDLKEIKFGKDGCTVLSGILLDPYTGEEIKFSRENPSKIQIDHVVALSNAWQTGAQNLSTEQREQLANDDLELIAVDGKSNQQKSDGDAATWLPKNKYFRCQYVARQLAVKQKYSLWLTPAEFEAMQKILASCPEQKLPKE